MAVAVPVMQVGVMRVLVSHGLVAVHVAVRLRHGSVVLMLVMGVMHMAVLVLQLHRVHAHARGVRKGEATGQLP